MQSDSLGAATNRDTKLMVGCKSSFRNALKAVSLNPTIRVNFCRRLLIDITAGPSPTFRSSATLFKLTTDEVAPEPSICIMYSEGTRFETGLEHSFSGLKFFAICLSISREYQDEINHGRLVSSPPYMINLSFYWTAQNLYAVVVTL
jgi:hypothetical protein